MKPRPSRPKKSSSSKARPKERGCVRRTSRSTPPRRSASGSTAGNRRPTTAAAGLADTAALSREFRAWRAEQPTDLERDTLLVPEWVAESVVQEVERFLDAKLRDDFAERLAAKAHHLYPRHAHFKKMLNRPGNRGRDNLYMYMRHWTASWLKRERLALYRRMPWSYSQGQRLPQGPAAPLSGGAKKPLIPA
jgi:hypothetical protein